MNHHPTLNDRLTGSAGYQVWESNLAEQCGAFHPEPPRSQGIESFEGLILPAHMTAPGYAGAKIGTNCPHIHRSVNDIKRDGRDFFYIVHQVSGNAVMDHCGSQSVLTPGDLVLLDSSRPSDFYFSGMSEQISLLIPRHKLESNAQSTKLILNQKICSVSKVGAVAGFIANQLFNDNDTGEDIEAIMDALVSLIRPTFTVLDKQAFTYNEKVQKSYFEKAQRCIEAQLSNFELTPEIIASELGTSKRTLHRIFAQQGVSIGRYILDRRLDKCAAEFEAEDDIQKISAVAFAWGFNDVSHFSRAFKSRFGVSPRGYRSKFPSPLAH
ncbi:transcriptional regulator FeaR [Pseudomonas putida]|uniref:transcriptional regulator FeaR n=1 Tax=Pseudomonas putida TaxID=303 RepID=UPI0015765BC4|nr:transcriptional regulator FeaR [Pseudomonas putida]NTY90419.1 transcriptional regulator FeaR [Pseudomonas putida]NTY98961.1 transcriptional regulator FeaR [Pseudomonas putida]NTZ21244.1 transcriptional regulator FeaR [Pseudomonas putida]NTZ53237.1 transcriptional regulator FeaR [Pseudomonas putida]NTZ65113.1 transcriptional regulator FeaR [Pseudomonas putida]